MELTARHIAELDAGSGGKSLAEVARAISDAVSQDRDSKIVSVLVGAQLLADSSSLAVPSRLNDPDTRFLGVAVRHVPGEGGRPMLQVLFAVGR
jgi:hypothetical protein